MKTNKSLKNIWVTSDTHFFHKNICQGVSKWDGGTRPFQTLEEMNQTLLENINAVVGEDDTLIHLGDVAFASPKKIMQVREAIVCKNMYLVYGNHDRDLKYNKDGVRDECFFGASEILELRSDEMRELGVPRVIMFHFPMISWENMGHGSVHLHGHCHGSLAPQFSVGRMKDVGVDTNDMKPYNLHDLLVEMSQIKVQSTDHHKGEHPDY